MSNRIESGTLSKAISAPFKLYRELMIPSIVLFLSNLFLSYGLNFIDSFGENVNPLLDLAVSAPFFLFLMVYLWFYICTNTSLTRHIILGSSVEPSIYYYKIPKHRLWNVLKAYLRYIGVALLILIVSLLLFLPVLMTMGSQPSIWNFEVLTDGQSYALVWGLLVFISSIILFFYAIIFLIFVFNAASIDSPISLRKAHQMTKGIRFYFAGAFLFIGILYLFSARIEKVSIPISIAVTIYANYVLVIFSSYVYAQVLNRKANSHITE